MPTSNSGSVLIFTLLAGCSNPPPFQWIDLGENMTFAAYELPTLVDFESVPLGPFPGGTTLEGVRFEFPGSPGQIVLSGDTRTPERAFSRVIDPSRYHLDGTAGPRILSPGGAMLGPGPDAAVEQDHLTLHFDPPVRGAWIAVLLQSLDGRSHVDVRATLEDGRTDLRTLEIPHYGDTSLDLSGHITAGLRAPQSPLVRLEFIESDSDAQFADCNVGYDGLMLLR